MLYNQLRKKNEEFIKNYNILLKENFSLQEEITRLEKNMDEYFFFYDLIRNLAPLIGKGELFNVFFEKIQYLGKVEKIESISSEDVKKYMEEPASVTTPLRLYLEDTEESLYIKSQSENIIKYIPNIEKLLNLCMGRIILYHKLQQLSIYDSLTGVYNRRYSMHRFFEEFRRSKQFNLNLAVLMVDIDYFKKINDAYGHLVGDVVLREVSRLIRNAIREIDFIGRFGGEEFFIIFPETDKAGAIMVAERICNTISQEKIYAFDEVLTTTISIGVAAYPYNTIYQDMLMEIADKALYKAKLLGRNRVSWF